MGSILKFINELSLRNKLVSLYIILITIPVFLFGWKLYGLSIEIISDIARKNSYELVKK